MGGKNNNKRHAQGTNKSADKKRRRENEETWKNTRGDAATEGRWSAQVVGNKRFEAFYKAQGFVGDHEWSDFMTALGNSLPACFRINADYAFADELKEQLLSFVGKTIVLDGVEIDAVQQMSWYPSAYKLGTDRKSIRKLPGLEGLHKWMMQHTDCGNITRQEAGRNIGDTEKLRRFCFCSKTIENFLHKIVLSYPRNTLSCYVGLFACSIFFFCHSSHVL